MTHAQIPLFGKGSPVVTQGLDGGAVDGTVVDIEGGGEGHHQEEEVGKVIPDFYHTQQASTRPIPYVFGRYKLAPLAPNTMAVTVVENVVSYNPETV